MPKGGLTTRNRHDKNTAYCLSHQRGCTTAVRNLDYGGVMSSKLALFAGLGFIVSTVPLAAHHSFEAEYDFNKPLKITGTVTKVEWMNPHARFYVDVKGADGKVTNWNFELGPINTLLKQGWRKTSLKEGDEVTVEGYLAKDGDNLGNARKVTLPDGRRVLGGSSADNPANQ
jgi:hypothetical protein